ncbi:MAG: VOC family protein [Fimbriimonadales bacterium]
MDLTFETQGIDHVALGVSDPLRAAKWYYEVLGLKRLHENVWGKFPVVIGAGSTSIALFPIRCECEPPPGAKQSRCGILHSGSMGPISPRPRRRCGAA